MVTPPADLSTADASQKNYVNNTHKKDNEKALHFTK